MSVDIQGVIMYATFRDDRLRDLGVAIGQISQFPIDLRRRPYNTFILPCKCDIETRIAAISAADRQTGGGNGCYREKSGIL